MEGFCDKCHDDERQNECEVCGTTENLHMHHPDYSKPAWVITLCPEHHAEIHMLDKLHY